MADSHCALRDHQLITVCHAIVFEDLHACMTLLQGHGAQMDDEMIFMQTADPSTDVPFSSLRASPAGDGLPMRLDAGRPPARPADVMSPERDQFLML